MLYRWNKKCLFEKNEITLLHHKLGQVCPECQDWMLGFLSLIQMYSEIWPLSFNESYFLLKCGNIILFADYYRSDFFNNNIFKWFFFKSTSSKTLSKLVNIIYKNKILTRMCTHVRRQINSNNKNLPKGFDGHRCLQNHCLHTKILKCRLIIPYNKNRVCYGTHLHVENL